MTAEVLLFWVFSACTVGAAVMVIGARSPISSAMSLVAAFFFLAGIYVLLWAHTIAVLQVLVYAGAIMVLFLFVIMLLSLSEPEPRASWTFFRVLGGLGTLGLFGVLYRVLGKLSAPTALMGGERLAQFGTLKRLGELLYTQYLFPFEAVSLLLLVAIVGAVVVAKPRI